MQSAAPLPREGAPRVAVKAAVFARDDSHAREARIALGQIGPVEVETYRWTDDCLRYVSTLPGGLVLVDYASIGLDAFWFAIAAKRTASKETRLVLMGVEPETTEARRMKQAGYDAVMPISGLARRLAQWVAEQVQTRGGDDAGRMMASVAREKP
jgi:hypothetical protein